MVIPPSQFDILREKLAELLGFSDGVTDVMENFLTIDSRADMLDYLTQLLGSDRQKELRSFVDDVERVRNGELLLVQHNTDDTEPSSQFKPDDRVYDNLKIKAKTTKKMHPMSTKKSMNPKTKSISNTTMQSTGSSKKITNEIQNHPQQQLRQKSEPMNDIIIHKEEQQQTNPIKQPPMKGKASVVCGCFGTQHKSLTNCLYCGRISCEREGYDFCAFCGYYVSLDDVSVTNHDEAQKQKDRLLRYDREFAQRTIIIDDQADYYNKSTSIWLTEEEQTQAMKDEQQRQSKLHIRPNMTLNIN